ncbi:MAG TPA: endo-1,4-beta-xylanase [Candidatus Sulfotelmatobacter sp.]
MTVLTGKCGKLVAVLVFAALSSAAPTLRQVADRAGILIGAAVRPSLLEEPAYSATLSREFNMVEAEDVMKWWVLRSKRDYFDFSQADHLVRFAQVYNMKIRGHCLIWDHDNPDWLAHGNFAPVQLSALLKEHIGTVAKHYAGQVFAWDVVNEAIDEHGRLRDSLWYNQPGIGLAQNGTAYIEQAFRWAHEADPHALLFYNDAEGEKVNRKSDAIYAMVKDFKQRGVPIDGIGFQMHIPTVGFDLSTVAANMARFAGLGLQIHITELDIQLPVISEGDQRGELLHAEDLNRQANLYGEVARLCLSNPACTAIQTWGFTDKHSWIGSHSKGSQGFALPFDRKYQPKPAYEAISRELTLGRNSHH